jgi:DNA-binding IclR family transcriptional regulator
MQHALYPDHHSSRPFAVLVALGLVMRDGAENGYYRLKAFLLHPGSA